MRKFKIITFYSVLLCILLTMWFLYLYRNYSFEINDLQGLVSLVTEYSGFNNHILHFSFYLVCELILLTYVMPPINSQIVTRVSRIKLWKSIIIQNFVSVLLFILIFNFIHIAMVLQRTDITMLNKFNFWIAFCLNFVMMFAGYLALNSIFIVLHSLLLNKELSSIIAVISSLLLYASERYFRVLTILYPVYYNYYSTGIDLFDYLSELLQRLTLFVILTYVSMYIFEKRDILNE